MPEIERAHQEALVLLETERSKALSASSRAIATWHEAEKEGLKAKLANPVAAATEKYAGVKLDTKTGKLDFSGCKSKVTGVTPEIAEEEFKKSLKAEKDKLKKYVEERSAKLEKEIKGKFKSQIKAHKQVLESTKEMVADAESLTGLKAADHFSAAGKSIAAAGGNVEAKAALKAEKGVIGETAYKELGSFGKMKAGAAANGKQASGFGKVARVGGTAVGAIILGSGLKDLGQLVGVVGPDVDQQGKEVPAIPASWLPGWVKPPRVQLWPMPAW